MVAVGGLGKAGVSPLLQPFWLQSRRLDKGQRARVSPEVSPWIIGCDLGKQ